MELNITEMRAKAAEQETARAEEFKKRLETDRECENKRYEKLQALLDKVREKAATETRAAMDAKVDIAIENAKAEIKTEYAQKYGVVECDNQRESLKKMLGGLFGVKNVKFN